MHAARTQLHPVSCDSSRQHPPATGESRSSSPEPVESSVTLDRLRAEQRRLQDRRAEIQTRHARASALFPPGARDSAMKQILHASAVGLVGVLCTAETVSRLDTGEPIGPVRLGITAVGVAMFAVAVAIYRRVDARLSEYHEAVRGIPPASVQASIRDRLHNVSEEIVRAEADLRRRNAELSLPAQ